MEEGRKVAIIGAGSGGITAAKSLIEDGFRVTVFEKTDDIGGQWNIGPQSGVWESLHANTSKKITCFSDFPFNEDVPHFVHHRQMKEYFRQYITHFGFSDRILVNHQVDQSHQKKDGSWSLIIRNTKTDHVKTEDFDFLVVATGRYTAPSRLNFDWAPFIKKGGIVLPSLQYKSPLSFANKRVLVVGGSFSGVDIALDLTSTASQVIHSVRTPYWVIEKRIGGKLYDEAFWRRSALDVPPEVFVPAVVNTLKSIDANPGKHGGLTASDKLFSECSLCIGVGFNDALLEGKIKQRPSIKTVNSNGSITFTDGHTEEVDVVIEAIGFKVYLPSISTELASQIISEDASYVKLFHWTFHPSIPNLAVVGQFKSLAAYNPQLEMQGRWISSVWKGTRKLPSEEEMKKWINDVLIPFEKTRFPLRGHHTIMEDFAQQAGVVPIPENNPEIKNLLTDGLLIGALYRLDGPGAKKKEATELIQKWNKLFTAY